MTFLSTEIVNDKGRYRSRLRGRRSIWDFGMNNVSVGDSEVAQTAFRELSRDVLSGRRPDDNVLKCPSAVVRVVIDSRGWYDSRAVAKVLTICSASLRNLLSASCMSCGMRSDGDCGKLLMATGYQSAVDFRCPVRPSITPMPLTYNALSVEVNARGPEVSL